jgi:hypothetical protein
LSSEWNICSVRDPWRVTCVVSSSNHHRISSRVLWEGPLKLGPQRVYAKSGSSILDVTLESKTKETLDISSYTQKLF